MSTAPIVLALDLGGSVGFAYGPFADEMPRTGAWPLSKFGPTLGARLAGFENALDDFFAIHTVERVFVEAPLHHAAGNTVESVQQQLCLDGIVRTACWRQSIAYESASSNDVRREILGTSRFPKGEAKEFVMAWVRGHCIKFPDHNACDAVLVWVYFRRRAMARRKAA